MSTRPDRLLRVRATRSPTESPLLHRLRNLRPDDAIQRLRVHWSDHLVGDHAIAPHDESLRNAINPPIDAGAAGAVEADLGVGVTGGAEKGGEPRTTKRA
jgi:hypothetical protein